MSFSARLDLYCLNTVDKGGREKWSRGRIGMPGNIDDSLPQSMPHLVYCDGFKSIYVARITQIYMISTLRSNIESIFNADGFAFVRCVLGLKFTMSTTFSWRQKTYLVKVISWDKLLSFQHLAFCILFPNWKDCYLEMIQKISKNPNVLQIIFYHIRLFPINFADNPRIEPVLFSKSPPPLQLQPPSTKVVDFCQFLCKFYHFDGISEENHLKTWVGRGVLSSGRMECHEVSFP